MTRHEPVFLNLNDRQSHFFGSIVSEVVPIGGKIVYHVIDGQQRLTTITLMLLAIKNLIANEKVNVEENRLDEQIAQRFLIAPYAEENDRIKLIPVKSDRDALYRLFGAEEDYDRSSNLTINYQFFYDTIMREEVPVIDLYHAIDKLEIISITLDKEHSHQEGQQQRGLHRHQKQAQHCDDGNDRQYRDHGFPYFLR